MGNTSSSQSSMRVKSSAPTQPQNRTMEVPFWTRCVSRSNHDLPMSRVMSGPLNILRGSSSNSYVTSWRFFAQSVLQEFPHVPLRLNNIWDSIIYGLKQLYLRRAIAVHKTLAEEDTGVPGFNVRG